MSLAERIAAYDKASAASSSSSSAAPSSAASSAPAHPVPPLVLDGSAIDSDPEAGASPFQESPDSCGSSSILSPASESHSSAHSISDASSILTHPTSTHCRLNEHLAVLIPRDLWKPDRLATRCDKYACRLKFTLFERKHHCRKCGGIFCHACSARSTTLLDTAKLPFLLPPKHTPISQFAAPHAPVVTARVCDDCYEQLHGYPTPRSRPTEPKPCVTTAYSSSSLSTLSPATPPDGRPVLPRSSSDFSVHRRSSRRRWPERPAPVKTTKLEGDLDRYPLKDPSATCKAAGGGRWEPKRYPPRWDGRLPDGRIRYEVEAERMEEAERRRHANPVIVDGEIRVRKPRAPPPPPRGGPYKLPTF